jgi:asparagine synthase (glutamine-hydrolysing)
MCGIAGFFSNRARAQNRDLEAVLTGMCKSILNRGPDDAGLWIDEPQGIGLGHRRLSILDLSPAGHQPMTSADGRYVMVFNGEIYNFAALRRELEGLGQSFAGHSDTEMMLGAFVAWGIEAALKRFVGMFAFGLWDRRDKILTLARDRMGEKPLYYGWSGDTLLFGSELKALRAHPDWRGQIDRSVLALYLNRGYVPAPYSIYQNIFKLSPGTLVTFPASSARPGHLPEPQAYWSFREEAERGLANPFAGSEREGCDELDRLIRAAVSQQMVADVPLGAFLSGGTDSSTVVSIMQAQSSRPVKTFTIGFSEKEYNEAEYAKLVARHLGTDHTELYVTPLEAMAVIPRLPAIYDEPFSDPSQIPTFLVSQLARRQVTVSLSGDGGDELFYGYPRYFQGARLWNSLQAVPFPLRRMSGTLLNMCPLDNVCSVAQKTPFLQRVMARKKLDSARVARLAGMLRQKNRVDMYERMSAYWMEQSAVLSAGPLPACFGDLQLRQSPERFEHYMMWHDSMTYLPDDILVKLDRASMAVSLESRVPFLDHRVVEFALSVPLSMKYREQKGKWLLRQVLEKYLTPGLINRPKMGFSVPIAEWLRGPLRDWAESLLTEQRLVSEGWFDAKIVRRLWNQHQERKHDWQYQLWALLMFQAWINPEA